MQFRALSILCLVFSAQVFAVRELSGSTSRSLLQNTAISEVDVEARDGTVIVEAEAFSVSSARDAFASQIRSAVTSIEKEGGNVFALAESSANVYATAIAQAFAAASVQIISTASGGRACGQSSATAEASARASAQAFVDVLAEASNSISFASASATVEAITIVTVSAFASASANACLDGVGQVSTATSLLATAIGTAYIDVTALALALVTPNVAVAQILVTAEAGNLVVVTLDGRSATDVVGEGSGSTGGEGSGSGGR